MRRTEDEERDTDLLISTADVTERRDEVITKVQIKAPQQRRRRILFMSAKVDTSGKWKHFDGEIFQATVSTACIYADLQEKGTCILKPSKVRLTAYNRSVIKNVGTIELLLLDETSVKWKLMIFYVCEADGPNVPGLKACTALSPVKLNCEVNTDRGSHKARFNSISDLQKEYPEQFDGFGSFRGRSIPHYN